MEELSINTRPSDALAPEPKYDVYFSYSKADAARVEKIAERLKALDPDFRWFDEQELIPGVSDVTTRQTALVSSRSVAVLLGPGSPSKTAIEENNQAILRSINTGTPAFLVYLPGWGGTATPEISWLSGREPIDLRERFDDDGNLAREGLISLIAAVLNKTIRKAREWLEQREPSPTASQLRPPRLIALVVGIQKYQGYPELLSAVPDVQSIEQLLRSTTDGEETQWEIRRFEKKTKDQLATDAKAVFAPDAAPDDTLLFYFSGHGDVDESNDLYLAVEQTEPDDILMTAFPIKALANYVKNSPSRRKLVLLDCCFSGEASDETDWGPGTAVFMTSRQVVSAGAGPSQFTEAITAGWEGGAGTTGDLRDRLASIGVHVNGEFDRSIPLPQTTSDEQLPAADILPSARLSFNESGDLYVGLSSSNTSKRVHCVEMEGWLQGRQRLVANLIEMIDAVVSLVPPEKIPMESVKQALSSLGADLLNSALTREVRDEFGGDIDGWPELRLQLSFDERWRERDPMEQLPWESLLLCRYGDRAVWLERIVRAKATKSSIRRRPSRVIAWNAFTEATPRYSTGAKHLLTHLLRAELAHQPHPPKLVIKEPAFWGDLFQASESRSVEARNPQQAGEIETLPISDFDTFLLFAPVSIVDGEPMVWFSKPPGMAPTRASTLLDRLQAWSFSYLIIETIAGQATPLQGGSEMAPSRARSLQATTQLATKLARQLGTTVVAVCHLPSFINLACPAEGEEATFMPSFSGQFLRKLAESSLTPHAAAQEARRLIVSSLNREDFLDVGLPVVCRPEPEPLVPRSPARGGRLARLAGPGR